MPPFLHNQNLNDTVDAIIASRAPYPHRIFVLQPAQPWECEFWVSKRDKMAEKLSSWLHCQGILCPQHYMPWNTRSIENGVTWGFKDPKHAILFKLRWVGNVE